MQTYILAVYLLAIDKLRRRTNNIPVR